MKLKSALIFLLFVFTTRSVLSQSLSLKIISEPGSNTQVDIRLPIHLNFFQPNEKRIQADVNQQAILNLEAVDPGIIQISQDYQTVNLIHLAADEHYTLNFFDGEKWEISGTNAEGQILFNQLFKDNTRSRFKELDSIPQTADREAYVRKLMTSDLNQFKDLLNSGKISLIFYKAVEQNADIYYRLLLCTDMFFISRGFTKPEIEFDASHLAAYKKATSIISDQRTKSSYLYPVLLGRYLSYVALDAKSKGGNLDFDRAKYGENFSLYSINLVRNTFNVQEAEFPWATLMAEGIGYNRNEPEWIENFQSFQHLYPKSPYLPLLKRLVDKVKVFKERLRMDAPEVEFIPASDSINTFEQLAERVKGKVTYVDLWATWCVPCREELQISIKMHDALTALGIQALYLSIDADNKDLEWKNMAKGMGLNGKNMRATQAFYKYITETVPKFTGIPRYLILNREGKIVNWDARRPSDGQKLIDQLKSID
ncbi:TlpA family protein disulfide reductase [Pedobacter sp. AW1-32]|uniref:TlpA family protein disulfide reductase n=1 Tax=Pedobacter sp. AW1-32 TaxID=3383026 RepID=UPI003FF07121